MRSELDSLVEAQPLASVAPSLLAILSGILRYLDEAMALDLTETTVIDPGPGYDGWTVGRLREAIQAQIERVAATSPSSDVEVISRRITDARKRLDALQTVSELLKSAERAERLVREAENSLVGGSDELAHNSTAHLDKLLKERNDRDREGRELHSRIDRLQNELALISMLSQLGCAPNSIEPGNDSKMP